jgi:hypothetical protein
MALPTLLLTANPVKSKTLHRLRRGGPKWSLKPNAGRVEWILVLPGTAAKAAAWFVKTEIRDVAFRNADRNGRRLVPAPGNGPIWARDYEIGTDRPIGGGPGQKYP